MASPGRGFSSYAGFALVVFLQILVRPSFAVPPWTGWEPGQLQHVTQANPDAVRALPGWKGKLPGKWYSGYIKVADNMLSHYVYVERDSSAGGGPAPLLLWSNGGPGASSMFGLLTELGPFMLSDESLNTEDFKKTGVPTLIRNPSGWTAFADLLIFDGPPPVGFSYCNPDGPAGSGTSCGTWDDERTAKTNFAALSGFFQKYPHLRDRDLFLVGESYAGVYIPMFAREILENSGGSINLKGFAVGDACVGTEVLCGDSFGPYWEVEFMQGHQQFSRKLYQDILDTCGLEALKFGNTSPACDGLLSQMHKQIGGFYAYSLYDDCTYNNAYALERHGASPGYASWRQGGTRAKQSIPDKTKVDSSGIRGAVTGGLNDYPCGTEQALALWTKRPEVRKALNVPVESNFFNNDNGHGFKYIVSQPNLMPFYLEIAKGKWMHRGLRVLVYNGDVDPAINPLAAQNWTSSLGLPEIEAWRPWTLDSCRRMGGYVTRYQGHLDFLTIRGSGHMVPTYKPEAAKAFMRAWIFGKEYPLYNSSCPSPTSL